MLIKLQNVTDIEADYEKIKQYIMDTGLTITRTAPDTIRFSLNQWIYDLKCRAVDEYTLTQNGLYYSDNKILTDHYSKKFSVDFYSHGDRIEVSSIIQNGRKIRSYKTAFEYAQLLIAVNTLVQVGKLRL